MAVESYGDFYALPEGCIANALSLTSPKDACRLSLVASTFRSAAQSDAVWEKFLPPDYKDILLQRSENGRDLLGSFASKKELFLHLCDHPVVIDKGTKSFSLEKWSGKKCYMLAAKGLSIVWVDTPRYWRWISLPDSRFKEAAELLDVCWLEVRGKISTSMLSPDTTYAAYLVFKMATRTYGFEYQSAEASVGISGRDSKTRTVFLDPDGEHRQRYQIVPRHTAFFRHRLGGVLGRQPASPPDNSAEYPKRRDDGWMEVELGTYVVEGKQDGELEMNLLEVKGGNWKSGLIIEGIEIRPKESN